MSRLVRALLGAGTGLVLTADGTFSSDVIDDLSPPRNFGLTFTNLKPKLTTVAQTQNSPDCGLSVVAGCNDTGWTSAIAG